VQEWGPTTSNKKLLFHKKWRLGLGMRLLLWLSLFLHVLLLLLLSKHHHHHHH
jgi:hypothetical protein